MHAHLHVSNDHDFTSTVATKVNSRDQALRDDRGQIDRLGLRRRVGKPKAGLVKLYPTRVYYFNRNLKL